MCNTAFFVPCALTSLFHNKKLCLKVMMLSSVTTQHVYKFTTAFSLSLAILLFVFPLLSLSVSSFASSLSVSLCFVMPRFLLNLNRVRWHLFLLLFVLFPYFLFLYLSLSFALSLIACACGGENRGNGDVTAWGDSSPKDCQHVKATFNHLAFKELRRFAKCQNIKAMTF